MLLSDAAVAPDGEGTGFGAHPVPNQFSANGVFGVLVPGLLYSPTTVQCVVLMHDTPLNSPRAAPGGLTPRWTVQLVALRISAIGNCGVVEKGYVAKPTAKQNGALRHDMLSSSASVDCFGFGTAKRLQAVPFQCSAVGTV
jgi:hypothetical protein